MRDKISVRYGGGWADRVAAMTDAQVASIYSRMINNTKKEKQS